MLCLHYQDAGDRARALVSIAQRCAETDAHVAFVGPRADCDTTREAVRQLDAGLLPCLSFRPLEFSAKAPRSARALIGEIEAIRAALHGTLSSDGVLVAWVESPVPRTGGAAAHALRSYHEALDALARTMTGTIISAFHLADLPEPALLACVQGSNALINAKMIVPSCPSWLIPQAKVASTPVAGAGAPPGAAGDVFAPESQTEKLAALGHFAAGVAHELGNPLSIISSSLQYLHQRLAAGNDPASDFTMTALQNVERMHGLLRSMLDFAAVRKPRPEEVDLNEVISEVLRFTSAECLRRSITVDVSFDPSLPKACVDPGGVRQIILNLVMNALDAMATTGTTLRLSTCMGSTRRAIIAIENNGPAIPADVVPNLFRPFHTTKDGGTGLGLYLSRQIARDHGGDLETENQEGAVRFTLTLPLGRHLEKTGEGEWPTS